MMWPIPIQIIGTKRPPHFTFLVLYVGTLVLLFNFLLPILKAKEERIFEHLKISGKTDLLERQSQRLRRRSLKDRISQREEAQQNVSRRSHSTKVWPRRQESHLYNHWFSDMKSLYDETTDIFYPWNQETDGCQNFSIHFAQKYTFHPTALVSYPGSGNSWVRYLIEASTGIFTGSLFNDESLYEAGLRGEMSSPGDGRTIVQKSHHDTAIGLGLDISSNAHEFLHPTVRSLSNRKLKAFVKVSELVFGYRGILLVRNPYDALLSYWNYFKTKNHKGHAPLNFPSKEWTQFVTLGSRKWASLIKTWVENSQDLFLLQYEELESNTLEEVGRILRYLNVPVDKERLDCLMKHLEGPFHRPRQSQRQRVTGLTNDRNYSDTSLQDLTKALLPRVQETNELLSRYHLPILNYTIGNSRSKELYTF